MMASVMSGQLRHFGRFGAFGLVYGALAGALAGAIHQVVRLNLPLLLIWFDLVPGPRFANILSRSSGMVAILGAMGGIFFGAILGCFAGLLVAIVARWPIGRGTSDSATIRATVLGVMALGWLANAAISPLGWWELLSMAELGLAMLLAGWWLADRLARLTAPNLQTFKPSPEL